MTDKIYNTDLQITQTQANAQYTHRQKHTIQIYKRHKHREIHNTHRDKNIQYRSTNNTHTRKQYIVKRTQYINMRLTCELGEFGKDVVDLAVLLSLLGGLG